MLSKVTAYFRAQNIELSERFLIAVSGGMDSMALLHCMRLLTQNVIVAHVNHHLRGQESLEEARMLEDYCKNHSIPFEIIDLEPSIFEGANMQSTARDARYSFFREAAVRLDCPYICTAHHLNDSIETLIQNLLKGTGLRGIKGIPSKNNEILRPLSKVTRKEIEEYVIEHAIDYRNDSSNEKDDYDRNHIRLNITNQFSRLSPNWVENLDRSMENFSDSHALITQYVRDWKAEHCIVEARSLKIPIDELLKNIGLQTLLFELLNPLKFNRSQIKDLIKGIDKVGSRYETIQARLLVDRQYLIVESNTENSSTLKLAFTYEWVNQMERNEDPMIEYIDGDKFKEPLKIRKPKVGEKMQPLGMSGRQKLISDILIDAKIDQFEKERINVVCSGDDIVWLIGMRLDERFKIDEETTRIMKLSFKTYS